MFLPVVFLFISDGVGKKKLCGFSPEFHLLLDDLLEDHTALPLLFVLHCVHLNSEAEKDLDKWETWFGNTQKISKLFLDFNAANPALFRGFLKCNGSHEEILKSIKAKLERKQFEQLEHFFKCEKDLFVHIWKVFQENGEQLETTCKNLLESYHCKDVQLWKVTVVILHIHFFIFSFFIVFFLKAED